MNAKERSETTEIAAAKEKARIAEATTKRLEDQIDDFVMSLEWYLKEGHVNIPTVSVLRKLKSIKSPRYKRRK